MSLSIIIVNYRTPELTRRCIESIYCTPTGKACEVIVVDNDSKELFDRELEFDYPTLKVIRNPINSGFGRANNLGVSHASNNLILLLNSDMLLLPDTLSIALNVFLSSSKIGVLGCKLLNEDGTYQKSTYDFIGKPKAILKNNLIYDKLFKTEPNKTEAVMGSFFMMRKDIFNKVGGFDSDFFMYAEELELCHRIKKLDYEILYTDLCSAIHKHGGSSEGSDWSIKQSLASNALLYLKVGGIFNYTLFIFLLKLNFITNFLFLWKMDSNYRAGFWTEWKYHIKLIPIYLKIPLLYSSKKDSRKNSLKVD